jgi:hypothetical protein
MRGSDDRSGALVSYVDLEARVPAGHPLRTIRVIVNNALAALSPGFHDLYARVGRPDPDARLYRKGAGQEAKLCFVGHVLMENRHGLVVDAELTRASGHAERLAALAMLDRLSTVSPITLAADRGFDARDFVMELRERRVTPHIAQNTSGRRSAIDGRTTRHPGYGASQRVRKRIEEAFAWIKAIAGQSRTKLRGLARVRWSFTLAAAAYNLVRLPKLLATRGASL